MDAYRAGNVTICNAVGTGVADDKSIYPYVPKMIRVLPGRKPILNNVPTWMCRNPDDLVRAGQPEGPGGQGVHGAGGYGMLVGPAATQGRDRGLPQGVLANPTGYIAQPTLSLSSCPDLRGKRHRAAPHRPAPVRAERQDSADGARRADARGAEGRLAGGQFVVPGWWHQGHLEFWRSEKMLSRTADHLFWMSLHRARRKHRPHARRQLPDVAAAAVAAGAQVGWQGPAVHQRAVARTPALNGDTQRRARDGFMVKDEDNPRPSSACRPAARERRAVRGTLTTEVWETQNQTWLEVNRMLRGEFERDPGQFLNGSVPLAPVARRDGGHHADGRGRCTSCAWALSWSGRQHGAPGGREVPRRKRLFRAATEQDQEYDFYHWSAILRSVSASRSTARSTAT